MQVIQQFPGLYLTWEMKLPSAAAKTYFANFDAIQARRLSDEWDVNNLTKQQLRDSCLLSIYSAALKGDFGCIFDYPDLNEIFYREDGVNSAYAHLFRAVEKDLKKQGFRAHVWEEIGLAVPHPEVQESSFRFIELLPEEIDASAIQEILRASELDHATAEDMVKVILCEIMTEARKGGRKVEINEESYGIFYGHGTNSKFSSRLARVRDLLRIRGFQAFTDTPRLSMTISWNLSIRQSAVFLSA